MDNRLDAHSMSVGEFFNAGRFRVPEFQRDFSWGTDEIQEFLRDLENSLDEEAYFLGLIILAGSQDVMDIIDGQQRTLTLTLIASVLHSQAIESNRMGLAERLDTVFLHSLDYQTDLKRSRVELTNESDNFVLQAILNRGPEAIVEMTEDPTLSKHKLVIAYRTIADFLRRSVLNDEFKRLGEWAQFIMDRLFVARFVLTDPGSAYRVFETINTRGKELTTADLLKSFVLHEAGPDHLDDTYTRWQDLMRPLSAIEGASTVQFIRHAVTTKIGHVLPRDLYDVLTQFPVGKDKNRGVELLDLLEDNAELYRQMVDPTLSGSASQIELKAYSILNLLNVTGVRPILLATSGLEGADEACAEVLGLVIKRTACGSLGTGSVERRFGETARRIALTGNWREPLAELSDLEPSRHDFEESVRSRSMNKRLLAVLRASIIQSTVFPSDFGELYFIKPRNAAWDEAPEDILFWSATLGNTFLAQCERRPSASSSWEGFLERLLPAGIEGEFTNRLRSYEQWGVDEIQHEANLLAPLATNVWYGHDR